MLDPMLDQIDPSPIMSSKIVFQNYWVMSGEVTRSKIIGSV